MRILHPTHSTARPLDESSHVLGPTIMPPSRAWGRSRSGTNCNDPPLIDQIQPFGTAQILLVAFPSDMMSLLYQHMSFASHFAPRACTERRHHSKIAPE